MSAALTDSDRRDLEWLAEALDEPARALAQLERNGEGFVAGERCEYLALLALLPLAAEPREPSDELEAEILAAARREPRPLPLRARGETSALAAPRRGWLLPVAATLAVAALGLAGWQATRLGALESELERQRLELTAARAEAERLAALELENADLAGTISLLTTAGVEFCPLRPPAESPLPAAWGALAMSEGGEHWYLRVVGLERRDDELEYRLWFLFEGRPVQHSVLRLKAKEGSHELMNGETPERFDAVVITLEPAGSEAPSGPRLLFGNDRMQIL